MNKKNSIVFALVSYTSLWAYPLCAQQNPIQFRGQVLPECAFLMFNNTPVTVSSNLDAPEPTLVTNSQPVDSISIGEEKSIYESTLASDREPLIKFKLIGNRGSVTTTCNIGSTLSVSIDKFASGISGSNVKIRFAPGGTGIYSQAHQDTNYKEIAVFNSQGVTSPTGDTALVEVNLPDSNTNEIIVSASLTAQ